MESPSRSLLRDRNLRILFGVTLMVVMGVSSIAPAFPPIIKTFNLSAHKVAWLVTAFTVPGAVLTPVFGIMADRYGRKRILVPSLACFGLFGGACILAQSFHALIVLRFFQGMGAAALGALNMTIISDLYTGRERIQALGYNAGVLALGTTIYPLLGGVLAQIGWRWPFILPLMALPLALAVALGLDCPNPERDVPFMDYMRLALRRATEPKALGLFVTTALTFVLLYGVLISFMPLYLHDTFGAEPWAIGTVYGATSLGTVLVSGQLGRIAKHLSPVRILALAFVLYALSSALVPLMPGLWWMLLPVLIFGLAQGLNIPCVQSMMAELAPMEQRGAFMALNGMILRIGQTLGPLIVGAAYAMDGYDGVFECGVALALVALGVVLTVVRRK
ncbi:MFS transporter [Desulfocurvus sp. DL9XJH121]